MYPEPGRMNSRQQTFWYCVAIVALVVLFFHGSLGNEFLNWDDDKFIYENEKIQGLDRAHAILWFTTPEAGAYTPLSQATSAVDWAVWGSDPWGHHLSGLILHALNGCLVFLIARVLIRRGLGLADHAAADLGAFAAALLFALHPLRVESVAWASERRDVLSGLLGFAAVLAYLRHVERLDDSRGGRFPWYVTAFVLFFCALLSKAVVVTIPAMLLLVNIRPLRRLDWPPRRDMVRVAAEIGPLLGVAFGVGWLTLHWFLDNGIALGTERVGWAPRIAQSLVANAIYVQKELLILPLNPLDKFYHGYDFKMPIVWMAILVNGSITIFLLALARRHPMGLIAWICWLMGVGPFLGMSQSGLQLTADRYTYLASVPICIWLGGVFQHFWNRGIAPAPARPLPWLCPTLMSVGVALALLLGVKTFRQVKVWHDSETFWSWSLAIDDKNMVAWGGLGERLASKQQYERAILCYKRAVGISPNFVDAWFNMGNAHVALHQFAEAARAYHQVIAHEPEHDKAWLHLGFAYVHMKDTEKAIGSYLRAMKLNPSRETAYQIGLCYETRGEKARAVTCYREAALLGLAEAWIQWAEFTRRNGKPDEAVAILKEGISRSGEPRLLTAYAGALLAQKKPDPAELRRVLGLIEDLDRRLHGNSASVRELLERMRRGVMSP